MNDSDIDKLLTNLQRSGLTLKDLGDDTEELHQIKKTKHEARGTNHAKALYAAPRHANACSERRCMDGNSNAIRHMTPCHALRIAAKKTRVRRAGEL